MFKILFFAHISHDGLTSKVSLQFLRLEGLLSEAFAEEVLGSLTSSVASVSSDWNHKFCVWLVLREYPLEAITEREEILSLRDFALEDFWLDVEIGQSGAEFFFDFCSSDELGLVSGAATSISRLTFESVQGVVSFGECPSLTFMNHSAVEHLLFFCRVGVINESRVIIVVLSWSHRGVFDEPSEVFGLILTSVLRKEPLFGLDVVPNRVLLPDGLGSCISVRVREKVLADEALNMTGVPRHLLVANLVIWAAHPVFGFATVVTEHDLVFVDGRYKLGTIQSVSITLLLLSDSLQINWM